MKKQNGKGLTHVSRDMADDMVYQINQYQDKGDVEADPVTEYHQTRGHKLIGGVHRKRNAGSPFENYVTRGKSGPM